MIWKEHHSSSTDPGEVIIGLVVAYGTMLLKTLWWIFKHPVIWIPSGIVGAAVYFFGPWPIVWFLGAVVILLVIYRLRAPASFRKNVRLRVYNRIRRIFFYEMQWRSTMTDCKMLKVIRNRPDRVPKIKRFESNGWSDKVLVKLVRGQVIEELERNAPFIASAFGSDECRVKYDKPGYAWLVFPLKDPLMEIIKPFPIYEHVDLGAVPLGLTDEGDVWTVPAMSSQGAHMLVVATTGAGKGSIPWALAYGISAHIRDGLVRMWVADPKGGVEFRRGRPLWYRYADTTKNIMLMLKEAVAEMEARSLRQADTVRMHEPTLEEPLELIYIDEILTITALAPSATRTAFHHLLGLLLTKGRAVGFVVFVLSQDARMENLSLRGFFPRQWAGRLDEPIQVDMVLGEGARDRGARCDDHRVIPTSLPGVGFVKVEGHREPVRVRSFLITDDDIDYMIENYSPEPSSEVAIGQTSAKLKSKMEGKKAKIDDGEIRLTPRLEVEREAWLKFFKDQVDGKTVDDAPTEQLKIVETV